MPSKSKLTKQQAKEREQRWHKKLAKKRQKSKGTATRAAPDPQSARSPQTVAGGRSGEGGRNGLEFCGTVSGLADKQKPLHKNVLADAVAKLMADELSYILNESIKRLAAKGLWAESPGRLALDATDLETTAREPIYP